MSVRAVQPADGVDLVSEESSQPASAGAANVQQVHHDLVDHPEKPASPGRPASSSRLPGVDGLRALAALWVVAYHISAFSTVSPVRLPGLSLFLSSGSTGVSLFLVLSGFCLYAPFAGGRHTKFRAGTFFVRRCRRLMPAYYASLGLALALNVGAGAWMSFRPLSPFEALQQVTAHAALIHTLFPTTFYALNGAYWSLGLEWQLYLALPLLIWGIARFGIWRTVMAAVLCNVIYGIALVLVIHQGIVASQGMLAGAVLPNQLPGRWAEFVFGMVAAELYATGKIHLLARRAWIIIPVLLPVAVLLSGLPLRHIVYGVVFASLLSLVLASDNPVNRIMSWSPIVAIGTMSYSLYLVHQPLVQDFAYFSRVHLHTSPSQTFFILVVLVPIILSVAWALFMTVERHTLTSGQSRTREVRVQAPSTTVTHRW